MYILNKHFANAIHNSLSPPMPSHSVVENFKDQLATHRDDEEQKPIQLAENTLDNAGQEKPGEGWVIGPQGYWQIRIGAETELVRGSDSNMQEASAPQNMPACEPVCVGIATAWTVHSGDDVSSQVKNTTDIMTSSSNEGVKAAGEIIDRYKLPYNIYNAGTQLPDIQKTCSTECTQSPVDFQLNNDGTSNE